MNQSFDKNHSTFFQAIEGLLEWQILGIIETTTVTIISYMHVLLVIVIAIIVIDGTFAKSFLFILIFCLELGDEWLKIERMTQAGLKATTQAANFSTLFNSCYLWNLFMKLSLFGQHLLLIQLVIRKPSGTCFQILYSLSKTCIGFVKTVELNISILWLVTWI